MKEFAREGVPLASRVAAHLRAAGALVAIFDINKAAGEKLAADCQKLGQKVHFYVCDVSDKNAVVKTVDEFAKLAGGKLHFLINNGNPAKLASERFTTCWCCPAVYFGSKALDAEKADWDKSFGVNVVGYANMVQAAHKYLKAAGAINGDRLCVAHCWRCECCAGKSAVVNNASISAHIAQPNRWTCTLKAAVSVALPHFLLLLVLQTPRPKAPSHNSRAAWSVAFSTCSGLLFITILHVLCCGAGA